MPLYANYTGNCSGNANSELTGRVEKWRLTRRPRLHKRRCALYAVGVHPGIENTMPTTHLIRLAVGVRDMNHLAEIHSGRLFDFQGQKATYAWTRRKPTREDDLLNGGSLYWVIKGHILIRQRFLGFDMAESNEGSYCRMILEARHMRVAATHKKAFQGWRYLKPEEAPKDAGWFVPGDEGGMPPEVEAELRALGL